MKLPNHVSRDKNGVAHIQAGSKEELFYLFGFIHAYDRGLQMLLTRVIGQGRLCELINDSQSSLKLDTFFRRMNWGAPAELPEILKPETAKLGDAYIRGINNAFDKRIPWELKILPYRHEPWTIHDSLLINRMVGYVSLSQTQANIERLFVEMVQSGLDDDRLEELFPGEILAGFDRDLVDKVTLGERTVPERELWETAVPGFTASNSWVIHGTRTASGKPLLANDPHLDTARLPAVWYELAFHMKDYYAMGATMPGLPGLLVGRTPHLSWGATYSYMDTVDSWIEQCRDGKYFREAEGWVSFTKREEVIKRKKHEDVTVAFYENMHGVLDGDPFKEGHYLATRWSGSKAGPAAMNSMADLFEAKTAEEGMDLLGQIETTWSWVLADAEGSIGFQMSGLMPERGEGVSGFIPALGWKKEHDWNGFIHHRELPRCINPDSGFFVTANNDLNAYGKKKPIYLSMGSCRADRIRDLLEGKISGTNPGITIPDCRAFQFDLFSVQAERFLEVLKPLLPDTPRGNLLKDWDCRYDLESKGAWLFERFYEELIYHVFGDFGFGRKAARFLKEKTGTFVGFYDCFDNVLLSENSIWFGGKTREAVFREAAERAFQCRPRKWKQERKFLMKHILLGDSIFRFLRLNRGPYFCKGNRATVHQGQIHNGSRFATVAPSFRMITDFSEPVCYTALAGGPSDRPFSRWYASDVKQWLRGEYKKLSP